MKACPVCGHGMETGEYLDDDKTGNLAQALICINDECDDNGFYPVEED